jgi:5-histidylcysteine sulfoxide synthase
VHDYFTNTWALYDWLFRSITGPGALYQNPDPLRHPLIFYLGHTAAFYINKLVLAGVLAEGLNERFEVLFARGVDPDQASELDTALNWPSEADVWDYRRRVFETVSGCIDRADLSKPITEDHPLWSLLMGLEHDRIHFETSSVLIRQYPVDVLTRPEGWIYAPTDDEAPEQSMIYVEPGTVRLGKDRRTPTFGWDNEYGSLEVDVAGFEASRNLVTNNEFMAFVRDGGYEREELWTEAGRRWRTEAGARHPKFWIPSGGTFRYRALFDETAMPPGWPAEVNGHEAEAYCRWVGEGCRLLSEADFARITEGATAGDVAFSDADNLNLKYGSPCTVGALREARSPAGFSDAYGNVWTWLRDDFAPLPGFEAHPLYRDFSEPFFDDQHATLLGGSWATTGMGASRYYRLWFRRHFFQHAGFRIARSARE